MDDLTHFYQVLGLKPGATFEEVKTVYRDLVKVWHPDRFSHDERLQLIAQEKLKEINGAYKMLEAHFFNASIQPEATPAPEGEPAAPAPESATPPSATRNKTALVILIVLVVAAAAAGAFIFAKKKNAPKTTTTETVTPAKAPAAKLSQYALSFDGSESQLAIATTGSLTGTFTVECWALCRRPSGPILSSREPKNMSFDIFFRLEKRFHIDIGDGSHWFGTNITAAANYNQNTWYHVACVVTPEDCVVFLNGRKLKTRGLDPAPNAILYDQDHQLIIGVNPRNKDYLDGCIADLRIWNTARTAEEIKSSMNTPLTGSEPGLQGYWPLKEGSGTNSLDYSGHGFMATLAGNISWSTNLPPQFNLN